MLPRCPECGQLADGPHRDQYGGHCAGKGTDPDVVRRRHEASRRSRRHLYAVLITIPATIAVYFLTAYLVGSLAAR